MQIPIFTSKLPEVIPTKDQSLYLRLIKVEDQQDFYRLGLDPEVAKFNNYQIKESKDSLDRINSFLREIKKRQRFSYAIIKNNLFGGYYGIWIEDNHPNYFREGIAIMPEFRRQGIYTLCSEAVQQVLKVSNKDFFIVDNVNSMNTASIAASKKRGFIQEGLNEVGELRFVKKIP